MSLGDKNTIRHVVFSSGAMGGYAFIGAIRALEEAGIYNTIQGISGCSAGAIVALVYSLGYSYNEILNIGMMFKYKKLADVQVLGLLSDCGLETGNKIIQFLSNLIYEKTSLVDLTFKQHWNITGRELWINASCITNNRACYYSVHTSPQMSILKAIRRSIGIPFLFTVCREGGYQYVDGGFHDTVPAQMFPAHSTLCFVIRNEAEPSGAPGCPKSGAHGGNDDDDFLAFCKQLVSGMHTTICDYKRKAMSKYKMIDIVTGIPPFTLRLSRAEKLRLIDRGYMITRDYLKP